MASGVQLAGTVVCQTWWRKKNRPSRSPLWSNAHPYFVPFSQRLNIIIVSEGAIDRDGNPITADAVKKVLFVDKRKLHRNLLIV